MKQKIDLRIRNLSKFEFLLWFCSVMTVTLSFIVGRNPDVLTLIASLIGVSALIFVAKGDVLGQILTVVFSVLYAFISFRMKYYGEMITYMGMTGPIALMSIVSWLKHPYEKGKYEVRVARMNKKQFCIVMILSAAVTVFFYYILKFFGNASLLVSTISVTTSFLASSLMLLRNRGYALAYGANDIVLIILWVIATIKDSSYLPMAVCFMVFLVNDLYGFINWKRIRERQIEISLL